MPGEDGPDERDGPRAPVHPLPGLLAVRVGRDRGGGARDRDPAGQGLRGQGRVLRGGGDRQEFVRAVSAVQVRRGCD